MNITPSPKPTASVFALAVAAASAATALQPAHAGERKFAYSYEVTTTPKGVIEFENWVTWKHRDNASGKVDRFDFRHELEFGVTERLQAAIYLADWRYEENGGKGEATYRHSGFELLYNLTNPTTDIIGSGLYFEALAGEDVVELEGKLLLQKNFGPLVIAYNAILEAEWEGEDLDERTGVFEQTFGISFELNKHVAIGGELLHEVEFPEWGEAEDGVVWAGPNISVRGGPMFATVAGLFQVTDVESEPEVQTRLIFGIHF